jgi:uncharacterized membrane protein YdbT with pleckstrin-like domain
MDTDNTDAEEKVLWEGSPSQWLNFKIYFYCILMALAVFVVNIYILGFKWWVLLLLLYPLFRALFAWYELHSLNYKLTNFRLLHKEGVFNRVTTETELTQIKEVLLIEPWYMRPVGLGDIRLTVVSSYESHIVISGMYNAEEIKEIFNKLIKQIKK